LLYVDRFINVGTNYFIEGKHIPFAGVMVITGLSVLVCSFAAFILTAKTSDE